MGLLVKLGKFWLVVCFVLFGVYLGLNNRDSIAIHLPPIFTSLTIPAFVALLGAFLCGATAMSMFFAFDAIGKSFRIRKLQKKIIKLEKQHAADTGFDPATLR